jgi:hypothetical protein
MAKGQQIRLFYIHRAPTAKNDSLGPFTSTPTKADNFPVFPTENKSLICGGNGFLQLTDGGNGLTAINSLEVNLFLLLIQ